MAKTTVTVAVLLLLFAVAQARLSPDLEKRSVNEVEVETILPQSDSKSNANFLYLPTEKPEMETNPRLFEWNLDNSDAKLTEESETSETIVESEETETDSDSRVVTVISFGPRNRQFRRPPFRSRRGHGCHHRRGEHVFRPYEGRRFRSYGNDMIPSEEGETDLPRDFVPGRWMRLGHGDGNDMMRMHHHHHRFEHPEDMHFDRDHHDRREHEHHHELPNDFVRKIRKFLNF